MPMMATTIINSMSVNPLARVLFMMVARGSGMKRGAEAPLFQAIPTCFPGSSLAALGRRVLGQQRARRIAGVDAARIRRGETRRFAGPVDGARDAKGELRAHLGALDPG